MRYMLITFYKKPGGQIDEQVGFAKKIRPTDQNTCNVILDFKERKVIKCLIEGKIMPTSFEKMHEYYRQIYPNLVDQLEKMVVDQK